MRKDRTSRRQKVVAALALVAGLALAGGLSPVTAGAASPAPQLSITVDNQQDATTPGARLSYTVTVTNLGAKAAKDLVISQTVPAGTALKEADAKGKVRKGAVQWKLDLPATEHATFHTTLTVGKSPPDELLRLATVACAKTSPKAAALVCASDSDQLPAGAKAEADQQRSAADPATIQSRWWYAGGATALVAAAFLVALLTRRSRTSGPRRRDVTG
jgi:uncharacterized repeat protein (TIGR01451 family)